MYAFVHVYVYYMYVSVCVCVSEYVCMHGLLDAWMCVLRVMEKCLRKGVPPYQANKNRKSSTF